jgi:hypothetical protein
MLAWDQEIQPRRPLMEALGDRRRAVLALRIIEQTVAGLQPPLAEVCSPTTVEFVGETVRRCQAVLSGESTETIGTEEFFDANFALQDQEGPVGASILMALSDYVDCLPAGLDADNCLRVMSACYEAVLNNAHLGRVITPADELANPACAAAIAMQQRELDQISS